MDTSNNDVENPPVPIDSEIENTSKSIETESVVVEHEDIDDDYSNQLDEKLNEIRKTFQHIVPNGNGNDIDIMHNSDSPLTISYHNSDDEDEPSKCFKELSYEQVERSLDKYYDNDNKYSNELDIMITFMKGQKNLYIQSHLLCKHKLHMLMIPAMLLSTFLTFLTPFSSSSCENNWNVILLATLNGITTALLTLINYLKLETSTQTFFNTARQFDKLETSLEFVASKLMFIENENEKSTIVYEHLQEVETKINEMKEWNSLFLPDEMRGMFPLICHINIFSFIKRMETNKKSMVERFKDIKNEIRYIVYTHHSKELPDQSNRIHKRLQYLIDSKDKIKQQLIHYRNAYSYIDELFTIEIKNARLKGILWKQPPLTHYDHSNPVVDRYIQGLIR